jgi:hypothetical protein
MEAHIIWIVFIKILFVIVALIGIFMPNNSHLIWYKEEIELVFFVSMAILLLYAFNPYTKHIVSGGEKHVLFLFGIVILITTNWKDFV